MDDFFSENSSNCPVCSEMFEEIIFQCPYGHPICEECCQDWTYCPQCRCSMQNKSRNRALEDLTALRRRSRGIPYKRNIPSASPSVEEKHATKHPTLIINVLFSTKCTLCKASPINGARFVCLFCTDTDYCISCFRELQEGRVRNSRQIDQEKGHVFALIENASQNEAFKEMMKMGNGPLFTRGKPERDFALACTCSSCARAVSKGFVCLHCQKFEILCPTCKPSNTYHQNKKDHIFAVSNSSEDFITIKAHFESYKRGISVVNSVFMQCFIYFYSNLSNIFAYMWRLFPKILTTKNSLVLLVAGGCTGLFFVLLIFAYPTICNIFSRSAFIFEWIYSVAANLLAFGFFAMRVYKFIQEFRRRE